MTDTQTPRDALAVMQLLANKVDEVRVCRQGSDDDAPPLLSLARSLMVNFDTLQAALAHQAPGEVVGWRPIETAPCYGEISAPRVLLFVPPYGPFTGFYEYGMNWEGWSIAGLLNKDAKPTHWMPLPTPPSQDQVPTTAQGDLAGELEKWIISGLEQFCKGEPDFTMSYGMRKIAAEHILSRPWTETLTALRAANPERSA